FRSVLAGRPSAVAHGGPPRNGAGPGDHQMDRGSARRNHHRAEPAGARDHFHGAAAAERGHTAPGCPTPRTSSDQLFHLGMRGGRPGAESFEYGKDLTWRTVRWTML